VTQMMGSNDSDGNAPKLIRVSNAEVIDIDKESFNIGRDPKSLLDYVINDVRVSRRHATIMHKGNNYFIVDLGSKNHTYVNGNMLISNMETLINNGDKIRIAFEEFIFEV
ncbi:MAG: FHA domain-containing protein, partial [Ruminococcus sp.]|nr:FHA domain-containing protein [Ruminococcus sp.]